MKKYIAQTLLIVVVAVSLWTVYIGLWNPRNKENFGASSMIGVHHLGYDYAVANFYVNKSWGGGAQREGGGGGEVCCAMIPVKWRPGLIVEVRWEVVDLAHHTDSEGGPKNNGGVNSRMYIARVPVEPYLEAGSFYVHFFPKGRVRVVTTMYSELSPHHPVRFGPIESDPLATAGWPVREMFTKAELDEMGKGRSAWR